MNVRTGLYCSLCAPSSFKLSLGRIGEELQVGFEAARLPVVDIHIASNVM